MSRKTAFAAFLLAALTLPALADDRSAGQHLDDTTVAVGAKAALVRAEKVSAGHINIEVAKGTLLLAGFVRSDEERNAAIEAVRYLNGVEKVIDGMVVQPGDRSFGESVDDTTVQTRLKSALASIEGAGKAFVINSEVRKGEVILSGFLGEQSIIESAGKVAGGVKGVKQVHNNLMLIP